jgi:hypothetical protein
MAQSHLRVRYCIFTKVKSISKEAIFYIKHILCF